MDNYQVADFFSLLSKLMDIHGENSFKAKSYASAAFTLEKLPVQVTTLTKEQLFATKGIGDSTGKKILEILETGQLKVLNDLLNTTPTGIVEMLGIKGLGPKKIATIWKELEVESIGELLYACNENRLTLYKGFGAKTQQNVKEAIEFYLGNKGSFLYAQVAAVVPAIKKTLENIFSASAVRVTGAFRRQCEVIDVLEFVVHGTTPYVKEKLGADIMGLPVEETETFLLYKTGPGLKIKLYTGDAYRDELLFFTTGTPEFNEAFKAAFPHIEYRGSETADDAVIFEQAGLPYIAPCLRENAGIIEKAQQNALPVLIQTADIKGIVHNHSNWSDGVHTIEQMADACIAKGMEYLVISDHSKSAFYANGLSEERIKEQHHYINELNARYEKGAQPFKIFKSIECDILNDGHLDYSDSILYTFDLIIASVHSNLKMSEEKAMMRLLKAIENPYTTILGHMTGRLLLSRNGYPVNHEVIADACARHHVVMELNAHPSRLDIDWRHIHLALEKKVLISIDPDAHSTDGFSDIEYGVLVAQKAGVEKQHNLCSKNLAEFESWLAEVKRKKGVA
jgi:DNA polymerase (family X)